MVDRGVERRRPAALKGDAMDHHRRFQPPSRRASKPPGPRATTPSWARRCRSWARPCAKRSTCASGARVLDVAAGNGNATLAAARRWCDVTSTDYVAALLDAGRRRAQAEGHVVTFREADAEDLPFARRLVRRRAVSTFGVMFTPDQERAARSSRACAGRAASSASPTGRRTASSGSCSS